MIIEKSKIFWNITPQWEYRQLERVKAYLDKPHPTKGQKRSAEFKANQSRVMQDRWAQDADYREQVQKRVLHVDSGREFDSITEAAEAFNVSISTVSYHCSGRYKTKKFSYIPVTRDV